LPCCINYEWNNFALNLFIYYSQGKMKRKIVIIASVILIAALILKGIEVYIIEPWIKREIKNSFSQFNPEIEKVNLSLFKAGLALEGITITRKYSKENKIIFIGELESINLIGVKLLRYLFNGEIYIEEITAIRSHITARVPFRDENGQGMLSPFNLGIKKINLDGLNFKIEDVLTHQVYTLKKGHISLENIGLNEGDSISIGIVDEIDFRADEFVAVSADSVYTFQGLGVLYDNNERIFRMDSFHIKPNYSNYAFTSRYRYQTDRIESSLQGLSLHDFSILDFLTYRDIKCSQIELNSLKLQVFRDLRKEFQHKTKPTFQDLIRDYPGSLHIDSIILSDAEIFYSEHAEDAEKAGYINFTGLEASMYNISNSSVRLHENEIFEFRAEALLMGRGRISMELKADLLDSLNTFTLSGALSSMEIKALNPFLEINEFIKIESGTLNEMSFSFTANDFKASGEMILKYEDLKIAMVSKETGETGGLKQRFISFLTNLKVKEANPMGNREVRIGEIDYERDPERFLFNYSFKAILSGIKSSLM
jgi:hypothetical protein